MTSHPSIDLFIVVLVELLTRGNWASPCVHVPQCAIPWVGEWKGWSVGMQGLR